MFGTVTRETGDMPKLFSMCYTSKYYDHEACLYGIGEYAYSPAIGRSINRQIDEAAYYTPTLDVFFGETIYIPLYQSSSLDDVAELFLNSDYGKAGCNPRTGKPFILYAKEPCRSSALPNGVGNCTLRHEEKHVKQLKSCCARVGKCFANAGTDMFLQQRCADAYLSWFRSNESSFECSAYEGSESCYKRLRRKHCCDDNTAKNELEVPTSCCNTIAGRIRNDKNNKESACSKKGSGAPCPFDRKGNIRRK